MNNPTTNTTKKCPMCAEMIPIESATCEYCGAEFHVTVTGYCTKCHDVREADEKGRCKQCGSEVADKHVESKFIEEAAAPPEAKPAALPPPPVQGGRQAWIAGSVIALVLITSIIVVVWIARGGLTTTKNQCPSTAGTQWSQTYFEPFDATPEDFGTGYLDNEWGTSTYSIANGKYHIEARAKQMTSFFDDTGFREMQIGDFHAAVDMRKISGPTNAEMGFMFRFRDWDNLYYVSITDNGELYFLVLYNGKLTNLVSPYPIQINAYHPGQQNRLAVTVVGSHFTVSVNNQTVVDRNDYKVKHGVINVVVYLDKAGDEGVFEFDNFLLCVP